MLRVLHPESRFGGDHYRESVVGKDLFTPLLDYGLKPFTTPEPLAFSDAQKPSIVSSSPPAAPDAMDFHDDHRASNSRTLMPIRSTSYMSPQSQTSSSNGSYSLAPSMRHDSSFPSPYSDSPVHSNSSYFPPSHQTPKSLGMVKLPGALPSHAVAHRYTSGSYPESQTSDSDRVSLTRATSASPVAPNVNSIPPVPSNLNANMQPTWHGFVHTTQDALTIIEACLNGTLVHCPRRPHDRERASLIRSGSVFVYEESTSGIKRWTDGLSWSPSRIMGNFLVYRELERPFPPGEKKRANRQRNKSARTEPYARSGGPGHYGDEPPYEIPDSKDRKITGSLVDSYDFKRGGLLKRTLSVTVNGCTHHLIAYYTIEDAKDQSTLFRPGHDHRLANCHPRKELITDQKFRSPIQDPDDVLPYPSYLSMQGMTGPIGSYASQYHPHQPYQPVMHGMSGGMHPGYHTSSQSMASLHASASSGPGYSALPASSSSPSGVFGGMLPGNRHSQGLVSPLSSLHLGQAPGHQPRSGFENVPSDMQGSVSLDYQPYPHETSYTTAAGSTFNQNFGFEQPNHGMSSQPQYHGSISEMSEDSQVSPDHMFGEGPVQSGGGYPCYSSSETQHSRHDTLSAFDDKAPHFSNNFS
ncbi:putative camp independent regulatory protein [Lasiodiplodia theobromae]|uniref:Global transcription regulator sge1 n=1 Tax=Lasiodiplodia theobromae TaxID=45133 RepID=A0A5N5CW38_9PEZI|nr:CAMP independent regulatory protein [Lasiodiplodia theobromae]KAB2569522.1 Global transcription regulator sge1 [Lasiodiplodia theobromae]KAF4543471.1 CAMP independent regulatory protein [Lasiodiplodia theobromae]KAF9631203.1 putative camp independent regulatory protein [Lasiodiplodia theobromae]